MSTVRTLIVISLMILLVTVTVQGQTPTPVGYRLGPDDVINIIMWDHGDLVPRPESQYTLGPGDTVEINMWPQTDFSKTVGIRPDGRISLPPIGELSVTGLTPVSLGSKVEQLFRPYLKNAHITIVVTAQKIARTNPITVFGTARTATVRPDGKISLPVLGELEVNGQTPDQVADRITRGLEQYVRNPRINVIVQEFKGKRVSVLGQVVKPGQYKLREDGGLADAVTAAGGPTFAARLQRVIILRERAGGTRVLAVNVERIFAGEDPTPDLTLQTGDIIIVPGSTAEALAELGKNVPHINIQLRMQGQVP